MTRIISIDDWFHTDVIFYEHTPKGWRETKSEWSGLGLSIVREYVRLMAGSVELTSQVGSGSLFRVSIPITVAEAEQLKAADESRRWWGWHRVNGSGVC